MKCIKLIILLIVFSSCESKQESSTIKNVPWDKNIKAGDPTNRSAEQDSLLFNKAKLITYFETKRDHTLVEINKIEFECVNEKGKEQVECLATLNKRQQDINKRIEELKKSSKESTSKLKSALDSVFVDLEELIEEAKAKLKKDKKK